MLILSDACFDGTVGAATYCIDKLAELLFDDRSNKEHPIKLRFKLKAWIAAQLKCPYCGEHLYRNSKYIVNKRNFYDGVLQFELERWYCKNPECPCRHQEQQPNKLTRCHVIAPSCLAPFVCYSALQIQACLQVSEHEPLHAIKSLHLKAICSFNKMKPQMISRWLKRKSVCCCGRRQWARC